MCPVLSVRLTDEEAQRIDRLRERLAVVHAPLQVSRSDTLRVVLLRGIAELERKPQNKRALD